MSAITLVTDGAAGAGVAVGSPAAVVAVGAGVLVGRTVGVGGAGMGVLVGRMAASVAAGKVGAGDPCAAGAVASPPPPQAVSSMDVIRIQPSTILKRGAFPEMNISYSSSTIMELDLVMACKADGKHGYPTHPITAGRVSNTSR
jgi:hypothetical protein